MTKKVRFLAVMVMLAPVLLTAVASDPPRVRPREASTYESRDSHEGITVAAEAYVTDEQIKTAFGNHDPRKYGVLAVYVVFFNTSKDALKLDTLDITLERARMKFEQIPGGEVSRRLNGFKAPNGVKPPKIKAPISPVVDQEFLLKLIPPGETAGGFLYFDRFFNLSGDGPTPSERAESHLYLNRIQWAGTGRELMFFDIALPNNTRKP